ncbi:hypothetical protein FB451DRAFT_1563703 [Mycena latifolia]|nr:hypothetical protein FB451DRAFT_1563703 [Mycena latifolia]
MALFGKGTRRVNITCTFRHHHNASVTRAPNQTYLRYAPTSLLSEMNDSGFQTTFSVSESDFADLRQNAVPDSGAYIALRESVSAAEQRLLALSSCSGGCPALEQECDDIRRYIAVSSSLLAPVRRLPPEILSRIFLELFYISLPVVLGTTLPPMICVVSSHWRAVAISTPRLWADFTISILGGDRTLRTLELHLARSKQCEISLHIRAPHFTSTTQVNHVIVTTLVQVSERWESADIRIPERLVRLFSALRGRLPCLKFLSFHAEDNALLEDLDIFEFVPRMYRLSLGMKTLPRLPRSQIQDLELVTSHPIPGLIRTACTFPNLRRLSFSGDMWPPPSSTSTPIAHTSTPIPNDVLTLSTLILCGPVLLETLRHLSPPNLVHLHIRNERVQWDRRLFSDFLTRSGCVLTSLTVQKLVIHSNDLLALFPLIPAMETLSLVSLPPNALLDKVMRALLIAPADAPVLSSLKSLKVWGSYLFSNAAFIDMLESRTSSTVGGAPLHRVDLMLGHRQFSSQELHQLRSLQGVSINLNLLTGSKTHLRVI